MTNLSVSDAVLSATLEDAALSQARLDACAETLADAFARDPLFDWLAGSRLARRRFFAALLEGLGPEAEVQTSADCAAVAVWEPSKGSQAWPTLAEIITAARLVRAVGLARTNRLARFGVALGAHHPKEPAHTYLMLLGVRPELQGRKIGSALLQAHLRKLDERNRPAFLETANPANVPLYERYGFEVTERYRPIAGGPVLWSMWRTPGTGG